MKWLLAALVAVAWLVVLHRWWHYYDNTPDQHDGWTRE